MIRIPYWQWVSWSDQDRGEVLTWIGDRKWYLDMDQDRPPKNSRISDFEEYTGESGERGSDGRGFTPPVKMQLTNKS